MMLYLEQMLCVYFPHQYAYFLSPNLTSLYKTIKETCAKKNIRFKKKHDLADL